MNPTSSVFAGTSVTGTVEYSSAGIKADLSGTRDGDPIRMLINDSLYIAQWLKTPRGKPWAKVNLRDEASSYDRFRTDFDHLAASLTHLTDPSMLQGLAYTAGPAETLDGVSVRGTIATPPRDRVIERLSGPQQLRYDETFGGYTGARLLLYVDEQTMPRRLIATMTGLYAYPTIDLRYNDWGATVSIKEPPADQIVDAEPLPRNQHTSDG